MKNEISVILSAVLISCVCAQFAFALEWSPLKHEDEQKIFTEKIQAAFEKVSKEKEEAPSAENICSSEISEKALEKLTSKNNPAIRYMVFYYGTARYLNLPDPGEALNRWFKNVLSYRERYPEFDKTFQDIIPLLEHGLKMEEIDIYRQDLSEEQIRKKAAAADIFLYFTTYTTDPKVFPCPKRASGCYHLNKETGQELIFVYVPPQKILDKLINPTRTLTHEFGHSLGFGDLYKGKTNADLSKGSGKKNGKKGSIMNRAKELTCDDADGMIAMIDRKLGLKRVFDSLCMDGSRYINGKYFTEKDLKELS
jgi:hypothetical protein